MSIRSAFTVCLLLCSCALAQQNREDLVEALDDARGALRDNPSQRGVQPYAMPEFTLVLLKPGQIGLNAQTIIKLKVIQFSPELVDGFKDAPGELAFILAHEIGHLADPNCEEQLSGRHLPVVVIKQTCESRADEIGMHYLLAAGFGPFDGAGAMGRLMLFNGNENTVKGIVFGRFTSDHPVDIDRIRHLVDFARATCQQRPEICGLPSSPSPPAIQP